MGHRKAPDSMAEARLLLDRALESTKGMRVEFDTSGQAQRMRQRCHTVIRKERDATYVRFSPGDPQYGVTPYDTISLFRENKAGTRYAGPPRLRKDQPMDDGNWLVFQKMDRIDFNIEELE